LEQWQRSEVVYEGSIFRVRTGEAVLDDGSLAQREVVEHPGGVCVIPFDGAHVLLIRQFRIAVGEYVLEAPAGKLEGGETPEHRGRLEVEEEAGHRAGTMIPAGSLYATVGYCSEKMHLFLAFDLAPTAQRLDAEERIEVVPVPIGEIRTMLAGHAIDDAKTAVGLYALVHHLDREEVG